MAKIITLPGTIVMHRDDYINDMITMYLEYGYSEYASTIYAEEQAYERWLKILETRKKVGKKK